MYRYLLNIQKCCCIYFQSSHKNFGNQHHSLDSDMDSNSWFRKNRGSILNVNMWCFNEYKCSSLVVNTISFSPRLLFFPLTIHIMFKTKDIFTLPLQIPFVLSQERSKGQGLWVFLKHIQIIIHRNTVIWEHIIKDTIFLQLLTMMYNIRFLNCAKKRTD